MHETRTHVISKLPVYWHLNPAEMLPFILSIAVVIQATIFVGVQGGTLDEYRVSGCAKTSQLVWPG